MDVLIDYLKCELMKISIGKVNFNMVGGILVLYYGFEMLLNQVVNVMVVDFRILIIQFWEKLMIVFIEKVIFEVNLGVMLQNDGELVCLLILLLMEDCCK